MLGVPDRNKEYLSKMWAKQKLQVLMCSCTAYNQVLVPQGTVSAPRWLGRNEAKVFLKWPLITNAFAISREIARKDT